MSFAERAKLSMELISKQPPITLEEARAQAQWLKRVSVSKKKKKRENYEFWIMNFELVGASSYGSNGRKFLNYEFWIGGGEQWLIIRAIKRVSEKFCFVRAICQLPLQCE